VRLVLVEFVPQRSEKSCCELQAQLRLPATRRQLNPLLAAAFLDFRFRTSRPVARANLIQMG
jgi:hypothetical protein